MTNFPTSLDALTNPSALDGLTGHAAQHANVNDAIEAIEAKLGIDGSADVDSVDYKLGTKQDDLVSGTNIKTINGASVLGSGDLVVGGDVTLNGVEELTNKTIAAATNIIEARSGPNSSQFSFRNKLINGNFAINQRGYVSGTATVSANQYTLDRWRVVTSGQNLAFSASGNGNAVTAPAGGIEQVIEGANIEGGVYTLSWVGSGTATVNGSVVTNGGQTSPLTAGANVTVKFIGAVENAHFEIGSVATPFEQRPISVELAMCQRYYIAESCNGAKGMKTVSGDTSVVVWPFPVTMRASAVSATIVTASSGIGTQTPSYTVRSIKISAGGAIGDRACLDSYTVSAEL